MKITTVLSYSVAAAIFVLLTRHTLGSPVGEKSNSDIQTTALPALLNDEIVEADSKTTRPARQEGPADEDEDDEVTEAPAAPPSTAAPVPRPQYNESNVQSELNFISQFNLGPNGTESEAAAAVPAPPPAVGSPIVSSSSNVTSNPIVSSPVESRINATASEAIETSSSAAPITNEGDDDEDEADEDEQTEAPQPLSQPLKSSAAVPVRPIAPVATAAAAPQPPSQGVPQAQIAASETQQKPAGAVQAQNAQVASQPQEVDADNENEGDADNDTENEITQDQAVVAGKAPSEEIEVGTTGRPSTFESEYIYTVQYINDNQGARKNL